MIIVRFMLM